MAEDLPDTLDRVRAFIDQATEDAAPATQWSDVEILWAIVKSADDVVAPELNTKQGAMKQFLVAADRAVKGWQRANKNQIETIGRLQAKIEELEREARDAEDWQNEVAELIPEDADGINPEGAQEGIILDYMKHLIAENQRLRSAALAT